MVKEKNKLAVAVTIALIAVAVVVAVLLIFKHPQPIVVKTLPVRFEVANYLGMIVNYTSIDYGALLPGMAMTKKIRLQNTFNFPVKVEVYLTGVNQFLFSNSDYLLNPGEEREISFDLKLPKNMTLGNYSGEVLMKFYKI